MENLGPQVFRVDKSMNLGPGKLGLIGVGPRKRDHRIPGQIKSHQLISGCVCVLLIKIKIKWAQFLQSVGVAFLWASLKNKSMKRSLFGFPAFQPCPKRRSFCPLFGPKNGRPRRSRRLLKQEGAQMGKVEFGVALCKAAAENDHNKIRQNLVHLFLPLVGLKLGCASFFSPPCWF